MRAAVAHAWENVPYYRETMRRRGLRPHDLGTAADLARLPIIEREDVQRDPEYFVSQAEPIDSYVRLRTGATSGRPVTVFLHPRSLFEEAAHAERHRHVIMKLARRRLRYSAVRIVVPQSGTDEATSAFKRRSLVPTSIRIVARYVSVFDEPSRTATLINDLRPDMVGGFGSYIGALFRHAHERGGAFHAPRVVAYGADPLSVAARRLITERFGCSVLSIYGAIEVPTIGFECEQHTGHHLNVDLYPLRIVGSDGADVPAGESGDVVVSNLVNRGTVLFNYRVGDIASLLPSRCACGRSLPMLSFLEGRADDWLRLPGRERVHPQTVLEPLEEEEDVWLFQIVQEDVDRFRVAVVAAQGSDPKLLRTRIVAGVREQVGDGAAVEVSFVDELPRTEGGKTRKMVSLASGERMRARQDAS